MSPQRPDAAPAVKPIEVSADLKALMRRLKLGQLLDTLPERLALARTNRLPHHDFLELLFADEVTRRDRESAARRAKAAHLDPAMQLQAWDDSTAVAFDQQLWAELTSMRFLADAYNVLVMGPVVVGAMRDNRLVLQVLPAGQATSTRPAGAGAHAIAAPLIVCGPHALAGGR